MNMFQYKVQNFNDSYEGKRGGGLGHILLN
jgi:hypothetical protein